MSYYKDDWCLKCGKFTHYKGDACLTCHPEPEVYAGMYPGKNLPQVDCSKLKHKESVKRINEMMGVHDAFEGENPVCNLCGYPKGKNPHCLKCGPGEDNWRFKSRHLHLEVEDDLPVKIDGWSNKPRRWEENDYRTKFVDSESGDYRISKPRVDKALENISVDTGVLQGDWTRINPWKKGIREKLTDAVMKADASSGAIYSAVIELMQEEIKDAVIETKCFGATHVFEKRDIKL